MEIVNLTPEPVTLYKIDHMMWIEYTQDWYLPESYQQGDILAVLPPLNRYSTRPKTDGSFTVPIGTGLIVIETMVPDILPPPVDGVYYFVDRGTIIPRDRLDFLVGGKIARGYDGEFLGYFSLQQHKV